MKSFECALKAIRGRLTGAGLLCTFTCSLAAAQSTVVLPATVSEYSPFTVTVVTAQPYCAGFPVVGDMRYSESTLSAVLTHLAAPGSRARCDGQTTTQRRVTLPGLPRGAQTLRFDVTDENIASGINGARVAETVITTVNVTPVSGGDLAPFWTGTAIAMTGPETGTVLAFALSPSRVTMFVGGRDWLEVGAPEAGYTFKAVSAPPAVSLPTVLSRLHLIQYPEPYRGSFWTEDASTAQRLASEWGKTDTEYPYAVGKLVAGACPIGMSPVYRAFHPQTITHRWTQSRTAYVSMLVNGYAGDGPVWCAPALRGE